MLFIDEDHKMRFNEARDSVRCDDSRWLATAYLITSEERLYGALEPHMDDCFIDFSRAQFESRTPDENAIYNAAVDLWYGEDSISVLDLVDEEEIPDKAFTVIVHAVLFLRSANRKNNKRMR